MPECKGCGNSFPYRVVIDGVTHNLKSRSYCLDCSPFKSGKGYEHRKQSSLKNREQNKICPLCNKQFSWNKNNVCSSCRADRTRYKNKIELQEYLGGRCERCGNDDHRVLDFHHTKDKKFTISGRLHCSIADLKEEADKCILLCANCHRIEHSKDKQKIIEYYWPEW